MARTAKTESTPSNGHAPPVNRIKEADPNQQLVIAPLRQATILIPIVGETPLKILRFSKKGQDKMIATQSAGDQGKTKKKRDPKDFHQQYLDAMYVCTQKIDGKKVTWPGLNASGVRNGCIECCRVAGFHMTKAKMTIFCVSDGQDDLDATQLVRIYGESEMTIDPVRNTSGVIDLRPRAMFREWEMKLKIRFDEDQFSMSDVVNLVIRLGQQNGLGEGRPNGTLGFGTGNGLFAVESDKIMILNRTSQAPLLIK